MGAVELRDVQFSWPGRAPVLSIRDFQCARSESVFIQGPSGSGKSTLLGLVGGVLQPSQGSVRILGQDLVGLRGGARDAFRAQHIGFVFQMFNLIPYLSVLDNVLLATRFSASRRSRIEDSELEARRLLDALGLSSSEVIDRPVTQLSIGQQQRVAAARALIGRPELLIADEPTSALDADTRGVFLDLLMKECASAGTTVLFVSHDAALASRFDRTVTLAQINQAGSATGAT